MREKFKLEYDKEGSLENPRMVVLEPFWASNHKNSPTSWEWKPYWTEDEFRYWEPKVKYGVYVEWDDVVFERTHFPEERHLFQIQQEEEAHQIFCEMISFA
jgi:hypothetical protein